jgi:hypothetical protein
MSDRSIVDSSAQAKHVPYISFGCGRDALGNLTFDLVPSRKKQR